MVSKQHRRSGEREELDLLVHVVDGHVVHALEVGERVVEELEPDRASLAAGRSHRRDRGLLVVREHGLEALPVRQRSQRGVLGHEVVQVRRARPRLTDDEDRTSDLDLGDLGVLLHQVLDAEAVPHVTDHLRVGAHASERRESGVLVEVREHDAEWLAEPVVTEVVEARLLLPGRCRARPRERTTDRRRGARPRASSRRRAAGTSGRRDRRCGPPTVARSWSERRRRRAPASTGGACVVHRGPTRRRGA